MSMVRLVVKGVRRGAKYAPAIAVVVKEARGPATDFAKSRLEAARQRRLAVTKASSLKNGSMLEVLHGETPVWVVFSGDQPISAHPEVGVPLADLVEHADLDLRHRPDEFPSARERASSVGHKAISSVRRKKPSRSGAHADAELVGERIGQIDELNAADDRPAKADQLLGRDEAGL